MMQKRNNYIEEDIIGIKVDDAELQRSIHDYLQDRGYEAILLKEKEDVKSIIASNLFILSFHEEYYEYLESESNDVPVIFITNDDSELDKKPLFRYYTIRKGIELFYKELERKIILALNDIEYRLTEKINSSTHISIKDTIEKEINIIDLNDVLYIKGEQSVVQIFTKYNRYTLSSDIKTFKLQFSRILVKYRFSNFLSVHRSYIINLQKVQKLYKQNTRYFAIFDRIDDEKENKASINAKNYQYLKEYYNLLATEFSHNILILEDESLILKDLIEIVDNMKYYKALPASGIAKAINIVKENEISLALLDIKIELNEYSDGIDVAKHIKEKYPDVPIIFLTGFADDEELFERARAVQPKDFIKKGTSNLNKVIPRKILRYTSNYL